MWDHNRDLGTCPNLWPGYQATYSSLCHKVEKFVVCDAKSREFPKAERALPTAMGVRLSVSREKRPVNGRK